MAKTQPPNLSSSENAIQQMENTQDPGKIVHLDAYCTHTAAGAQAPKTQDEIYIPTPSALSLYQALYDYAPTDLAELTFRTGDLIVCLDTDAPHN